MSSARRSMLIECFHDLIVHLQELRSDGAAPTETLIQPVVIPHALVDEAKPNWVRFVDLPRSAWPPKRNAHLLRLFLSLTLA
jgi:hypothetical protein